MADLTIRFKGQPIVELSDTGTKTLKTAGKYCEDDISVEYSKPAVGGGSEFVVATARRPTATIRTEIIGDHIVSNVVEEPAE